MMNKNDTIALCEKLHRNVGGQKYIAYVDVRAEKQICFDYQNRPYWGVAETVYVTFTKGSGMIPALYTDETFSILATAPERILAHWNTWLHNHNAMAPKTMAWVHIYNGPGRSYRGKVVRTTKTRALVSYKFKNGNYAANKWFKLSEISW